MRDLFTKATDIVLSRMHEDIIEIKQTLKSANITVIAGESIDGVASYSYVCDYMRVCERPNRQDDRTIYKWIIINSNKAVLKVTQHYLLEDKFNKTRTSHESFSCPTLKFYQA